MSASIPPVRPVQTSPSPYPVWLSRKRDCVAIRADWFSLSWPPVSLSLLGEARESSPAPPPVRSLVLPKYKRDTAIRGSRQNVHLTHTPPLFPIRCSGRTSQKRGPAFLPKTSLPGTKEPL